MTTGKKSEPGRNLVPTNTTRTHYRPVDDGLSDVIITGCKGGLQTIALMRLLRANSEMGLQQLKRGVEDLMTARRFAYLASAGGGVEIGEAQTFVGGGNQVHHAPSVMDSAPAGTRVIGSSAASEVHRGGYRRETAANSVGTRPESD
jgi:hypothetical protein